MRISTKKVAFLNIVFILFSFSILFGQDKKKPITPEDYAQWQSIRRTAISENGDWIAYELSVVEMDDTLFVKNVSTDSTFRFALGTNPLFSKNSKWVAFRIGYSEKEMEKMRKSKKPIKMKMGLLNLENGKKIVFDDVNSFTFSDDGKYIAMKKYKAKGRKSKGSDVILRNLDEETELNIGNVSEYVFNKKGNFFACVIDAEGKSGNGVHLYNLKNNTVKVIDSGKASYSQLTWNKKGTALAFFKSIEDKKYLQDNHSVIVLRNIGKKCEKKVYNPLKDETFPEGMRIVTYRKPVWSKDNSAVFFGIMEWKKKPEKKEDKKKKKKEKEELKPANVDVWHWKDIEIQPRQMKTARTDSTFSYLSVWHIDDNKFVQLAHKNLKYVYLTGDQKHAYGLNRIPYQPAFKVPFADVYIVDTKTGEAKLILKKQDVVSGSSPDGNYLLYFRDKNWWTYDIKANVHTNITLGLPSTFWNTEFDYPRDPKPPWGFAGWTKADSSILIYDQYNVWNIKPDGKNPVCLTDGNKNKIRFRVYRLEREEDYIDPSKPVYLSAFGQLSKKSGFYRLKVGKKPVKLIYEDKYISRLQKAKKCDKFIYISETYEQSPNIFYTKGDFLNPKKLTDTNPQQRNFLWGHSELINYENADGVKLQGALFYPANFEPGKKYPMIVYIYQRLSQTLHRYVVPSRRRAYNVAVFTSLGYFVYRPDIVYKDRMPGVSAVNCVVPAVKKVLEKGFIDETKIGLMGHSWGAYQTCYIITQSKLFSAAIAGAPLTDLISMYSEVYWNTGVTNQVIFETSQGRFPDPFWKDLDSYMLNSPLFNMQNIETPLLVAFGDKDGAVDWHQGIELFNGMRRMQKPMIMLVYPGENHSLRIKENQIDYAKRQIEFFGHYLKGEKAPEWIKKGVPFLKKKRK
ncbi:S9 family peptidase [candidate division KSB1 bacterium]|nr:MAG: S9 family peptidase [candidate division KSB1 bacterium]